MGALPRLTLGLPQRTDPLPDIAVQRLQGSFKGLSGEEAVLPFISENRGPLRHEETKVSTKPECKVDSA